MKKTGFFENFNDAASRCSIFWKCKNFEILNPSSHLATPWRLQAGQASISFHLPGQCSIRGGNKAGYRRIFYFSEIRTEFYFFRFKTMLMITVNNTVFKSRWNFDNRFRNWARPLMPSCRQNILPLENVRMSTLLSNLLRANLKLRKKQKESFHERKCWQLEFYWMLVFLRFWSKYISQINWSASFLYNYNG